MRNHIVAALILLLACFTAGCSGKIELVGYGNRPQIQHGLQVELVNMGPSGAMIEIKNTSDDILSVNQSPQAMVVSVKRRKGDGLVPVPPCEVIFTHMRTHPQADDFVILAPGQTRNIPVPVSYQADRYRTLDRIYRIEKDNLYEVEVRLMPYFGTFTEKTAAQTLASFKIPNYSHEPLTMNTMIIRAR
jgi:hypothetical protein